MTEAERALERQLKTKRDELNKEESEKGSSTRWHISNGDIKRHRIDQQLRSDGRPDYRANNKSTEGASSKPIGGACSKPTEGASSKPTEGASSKPTGGASSKPTGGASSKPTGGVDEQSYRR